MGALDKIPGPIDQPPLDGQDEVKRVVDAAMEEAHAVDLPPFTGDQQAYLERLLERHSRPVDLETVIGGPKRSKVSYVGAPACFALEEACKVINQAFGGFGCYLVGSALERPDWRDIDVRFIMSDAEFAAEFPHSGARGAWEFDPKWILLTVSISERLSKLTSLPIDFQIQPQTHANERHKGPRHALGLRFVREGGEE